MFGGKIMGKCGWGRLGVAAFTLVFALSSESHGQTAGAPDLVLTSQAATAADPAPSSSDVVRSRRVEVDAGLLRQWSRTAAADQANPLRIRVGFFGDFAAELSFDKAMGYKRGQVSYTGTVAGLPGATATMSVVDGVAVLDVRLMDGRAYSLAPAPEGESGYIAKEVAEAAQGGCGVNESFRANAKRLQQRLERESAQDGSIAKADGTAIAAADAANEVDIIIGYTPAARASAGGTAAMVAVANQSVTFANTAYANSLVGFVVVPVWIGEITYVESSSDMGVDLSRLTTANDGLLDDLRALREAYRADMVTLLVNDVVGGTCGIAWQMSTPSSGFEASAYSVTARTCVTNQTFAHELGHNMGCAHARGDGGTGSYSYSYGHRFTGTNSVAYRTVMAYAPGTRIQYFSNPSVSYQGTATGVVIGDANEAHNAQTLNLNASTIANWRQRKTGGDTAGLVATSAINLGLVPTGTDAPSRNFFVGNSGDGVVNYTLSDNVAWLATGASGSVNGTTQKATTETTTFNTSSLPPGNYSGNITVTAAGVSGSPRTVTVSLSVADVALTNDNFTNAFVIANDAFTTSVDTTGFTLEPGEPNVAATYSAGASAWWKWTNTSGSSKTVNIAVSSAAFDTQLCIYTGTAVSALTSVVEDDDFSPTLESVSFNAAPGQTYYVRLTGYSGEDGVATIGGTLPVSMSLMSVE